MSNRKLAATANHRASASVNNETGLNNSVTPQALGMSVDEKLELARWHIERYDNLRSLTANRAAIVLSANALLLAGMPFLLDKTLVSENLYYSFKVVILGLTVALLLTTALSIYYAIHAIISPWTQHRPLYHPSKPTRLFFHARDTVGMFNELESFQEQFLTTKKEQFLDFALAELWTSVNQHWRRYLNLRKSIKLLIVSIGIFMLSIIMLVASSFV